MSGLCSAHKDHQEGCPQCEAMKMRDIAYLAASNQTKQKLEPMRKAFKAVALEDIIPDTKDDLVVIVEE